LTELGTWDEALLSAELNELLAEHFDLSLVGFSDGELDKLLAYVADSNEEIPRESDFTPLDIRLRGRSRWSVADCVCGDRG